MNKPAQGGFLQERIENGVLHLTLGGGTAHALSLGMIGALDSALCKAAETDAVRAVLIHGPGRIFCAGHDLKEIARHRLDADEGRAYVETLFAECSAMMIRLANLPKPTLAVSNGVATAGGLQLMAACDMVFCGPDTRVCLPGVVNGGFCTTPAVAVGRKIARNHLNELSFSGDMFDAGWAQRAGLINRILPEKDLLPAATEFAQTLATRHAPALAKGKAALNAQLDQSLEQAYATATPVMIDHFMDPVRIAEEKAAWL